MAKTRPEVTELPAQNVGFLFGTMMDLRMLPSELKHTGKVGKGEFKIVAHFPAKHAQDGTEAAYLARHRTFRGGLYATYQDGPLQDRRDQLGCHQPRWRSLGHRDQIRSGRRVSNPAFQVHAG